MLDNPLSNPDVRALLDHFESQLLSARRNIDGIDAIRKKFESLLTVNIEALSGTVVAEMASPQEKRRGLTHLRDFTRDAIHLTVIDPYIYGGKTRESMRHVEDFTLSASIGKNDSLKSIHVVYDHDKKTTKIRSEIKKCVKDSGIAFTDKSTSAIHDRIWIKDNTEAIVTGTSLGGIGNKLSFILDLPDDDLKDLKKFLRDQGLTKAKT